MTKNLILKKNSNCNLNLHTTTLKKNLNNLSKLFYRHGLLRNSVKDENNFFFNCQKTPTTIQIYVMATKRTKNGKRKACF